MAEEARVQLNSIRLGDGNDQVASLDKQWIERGTAEWTNFAAFVFGAEKIDILFAPYQVAGYASGAQFAGLSYASLANYMRPEFRSALAIEHLIRA
jgi:hypothetical protein